MYIRAIRLDIIHWIRTVALYGGLLHCVFGNDNGYIGKKSLWLGLERVYNTHTIAEIIIEFWFLPYQLMISWTYRALFLQMIGGDLGVFSWRREHFRMDRHNCGWKGNCLRGIIVQAFSAFPSRLPFQTAPGQIWDDVLPSKCWSIREHMPWYSPGINQLAVTIFFFKLCACGVKRMQEMEVVKIILRLGETDLFEEVRTRWYCQGSSPCPHDNEICWHIFISLSLSYD